MSHLYKFQQDNIGQSVWDEVRCYWEHVEEHIGNLMGTHWELDENTLVTTKVQMSQHPPSPEEENWGPWAAIFFLMPTYILHLFWTRCIMGGDIVGVNMPTDMHETSVLFTLFLTRNAHSEIPNTQIHSAFTIPVIIKLFSINADFFQN